MLASHRGPSRLMTHVRMTGLPHVLHGEDQLITLRVPLVP